ncbi:hypothetical protein [Geodermatophilus sp. DSM 44513]|uniref:Rv1733c family protein n=1 Tax=Geodermatophilus sp. DSM 44513 TaxID=1528104 RepID=UPI0012772244|nr:hypothetical protein [Geodermatophilus sp. DSM 44513]WNV77709.1 hypothetical protein RTG05_10650 [Geodermatophilus sp. DSM 44513]
MAPSGPLARRLRRLTLGSGPLKRGVDTAECVSRLLVLLVVLLSVPVALAVGTAVRSDLDARARAQAEERTRVTAVATADAVAPREAPPRLRVPVPARWTSPAGEPVTGAVPASPATRAGDTLTLWTTAEGRRTDEPMTSAEVRRSTLVLVGVGWGGTLSAVVLLHAALCRLLERRRDRYWTRGWARVEPTWSRRVP